MAAGRLVSACQSAECTFPWRLFLFTSLILLVQMLVGTIFFAIVMYGMLDDVAAAPRAAIGACVTALAWMGWSGITPQSRRLALGYLRRLCRKT